MKATFLFTLTVLSLTCVAQTSLPVDSTTNKVSYSDVIMVDSTASDTLYARAMDWFVTTFKSASSVIQLQDRASGKIVGKAFSNITIVNGLATFNVQMWYTVSVTVKDGRYKYSITDIYYQTLGAPQILTAEDVNAKANTTNKREKKYNDQYLSETARVANELVASLKKRMAQKETTW